MPGQLQSSPENKCLKISPGTRWDTGEKVLRKALNGNKARRNWVETKTFEDPAEGSISAEVEARGELDRSQVQAQFLTGNPRGLRKTWGQNRTVIKMTLG